MLLLLLLLLLLTLLSSELELQLRKKKKKKVQVSADSGPKRGWVDRGWLCLEAEEQSGVAVGKRAKNHRIEQQDQTVHPMG